MAVRFHLCRTREYGALMGSEYKTTCRKCGHRFILHSGGGVTFEQLRCEACGRATAVLINGDHVVDPSSEAGWARRMESKAGKCKCGGQFKLDAKPRCPKCRSLELDMKETGMLYD